MVLGSIDCHRHLRDLNPAQRSAVEYGIGGGTKAPPALLIAAGAGTGKTKTLAHRVAHLILNGANPQRLLLLTFTRRAALEMTRRAHQILARSSRRRRRSRIIADGHPTLVGNISFGRQPPFTAPRPFDRA